MPAFKHGLSRPHNESPEYRAWLDMRNGGRGITVCERWLILENFLADMGPRPSADYSLERLDNDREYSPDNCTWATKDAQTRNQRRTVLITVNGKTLCIKDWAKKIGLHPATISERIKAGVVPIEAVTRPNYKGQGKKKKRRSALPR